MLQKHLIFKSKEEAERIIPINTIKKIQINTQQFCLANTLKGFVVFQKECPHAGADLSRGTLNIFNQIVCPFHAYIFDLNDGREERQRCSHIKIYNTEWESDKLYVLI